jgi:DNA-binding transcriptional LysR family regulator
MVVLGREALSPWVAPAADGKPLWLLPGQTSAPVPYLGYASGAYLGRMVEHVITQARSPVHLEKVYETDMAEGLKAMALQGHGMAFLPQSAVTRESAEGQLISAGSGLSIELQVRLYRARPSAKAPAKRDAQALWHFLQARHGDPATQAETITP